MMGKININKTNDLDAIRAARQSSVKTEGKNKTESGDGQIRFGEDKIQLSERAGEVGKLVNEIKNLPDVRQARVNELREQIASGEYAPSGEKIADAILSEE